MKRVFFYLGMAVIGLSAALTSCGNDKEEVKGMIEIEGGSQSITVPANETSVEIAFTTNDAWSAVITPEKEKQWLSFLWESNSGSKADRWVIQLGLTENTTDADREATVTITCKGTSVPVKVKQEKE
jgi:hypothetical protein